MKLFVFIYAAAAMTTSEAAGVHAATALRPGAILTAADIEVRAEGGIHSPDQFIGMELIRAVYPGQQIRLSDLRAPTLVKRNDIVSIEYRHGALAIIADARALDRGAAGDRIRVMNLGSRTTITATVTGAGRTEVR